MSGRTRLHPILLMPVLKRYMIFIFVPLLMPACADKHDAAPSDFGAINVSIEWHRSASGKRSVSAADICTDTGVGTVVFEVYDGNTSLVANSFPCKDHGGTVDRVPAGSNRKLVITARNSSGKDVYRGEIDGITVIAGQTANAGSCVLLPVGLVWGTSQWGENRW